ncbi:MAG: GntR family transcriptional regulator [Gordonia sp. (in: high G+C Gram-positive bacteria)]
MGEDTRVDDASGSSRPDTLVARLERFVADAAAEGSEKLPSERDLAELMHTPRSTLRRAMADLERRGRIFRVRGRSGGAFITAVVQAAPVSPMLFDPHSRKLHRDLTSIKGIPQMLDEQGFTSQTKVLSETIEGAPASIASALGLDPGAPVISLLRLRLSDAQPLSLERMYLDRDRFPDLLAHSPISSLYSLLEAEYGIAIATSDETIEVVSADRQVATLLGVRRWAPVLAVRRVTRCADGTPVEASIDLFRPDRTRLSVRIVVG